MVQQQKMFRVKALKQFKCSIDGAAAIMVHPESADGTPGDVVEVDRFLCGMLVSSLKAEVTEEALRINKNWKPIPREVVPTDSLGAVMKAIETLTNVMRGGKFAAKGA